MEILILKTAQHRGLEQPVSLLGRMNGNHNGLVSVTGRVANPTKMIQESGVVKTSVFYILSIF